MANSIFIKADELAKELDISQGLAYKMIAQWNEELKAKGYTTVGGRVPEAEPEAEQAGSHHGRFGKPVSAVLPAARRMGARSSHI